MVDQSSEILTALSRIRTTVRRRLLAFGVCAVLSVGCLSFLGAVTMDWLLDLPPLLRIFGAALIILGFGLAILRWLVRPLQTRFSLAQIAGKLEQHYPGLDDRLSSTVSFLTTPTDASPTLMRQVVRNTARIISRLQIHSALTYRPLLRQVGLLICVSLTMVTILAASPDWVSVGTRRYLRPFDAPQWPRDVEIEQLTGSIKVAVGDSTTVRMRVTRGARSGLRGVVHLVDGQGHRSVLGMHSDANNEYRCGIDAISTDLAYWFEVGDADTRRTPGRIVVVLRPAVAKAIATVHPPSYADQVAPVVTDMMAGSASAVTGGVVDIELHTTKPIRATDGGGPDAWLEMSDGQTVPLSFGEQSSRLLKVTIPVDGSISFSAHLVDRDGLSSRGGRTYHIEARPDRVPVVVIIEPRAIVETTPRGSVAMLIRAQDDFGLTDLRLVGRETDSQRPIDLPLLGDAQLTVSDGRVTAVVDYVWRIESMKLEPPATLVYRVQATDNCRYGEVTGQVGTSARMRVKVISELELDNRLRDQLSLLQKRIRRVWLEQETVKDETGRLQGVADSPEGLSRRVVDEDVGALADRQGRLGRRLTELSAHFGRLGRRMELNRISDRESIEQVGRLQGELEGAARGPMSEAVQALELLRAGDETSGGADSARLGEAIDRQRAAIELLRDVLGRMDRWGDFQSLVMKTRDLVDRQQELGAETAELARRTIGRRVEELDETDHGELRQLQRRQDQLAGELEVLLTRIRKLVKPALSSEQGQIGRSTKSDFEVVAMERALRAATAGEIGRRMTEASGAIRTNRLAGAGVHQRSVRQWLSKMLSALQERELRRLAELAKRAERAERAVAHLLAEQEALLEVTEEAVTVGAEDEVFVGQSSTQGQIERNAVELEKDLAESVDTSDAADLVRQATRFMNRAASALSDARGPQAGVEQREAVDRLGEARDLLEERARMAAHAASQRMMSAIRARLEEVYEQQQAINVESGRTVDAIVAQGRLDRAIARQAAKLARVQGTLRQTTDQLRGTLVRTVVYGRVLRNIVADMQTSGASLDARRLDATLVVVQKRIERRLDQLIRALLDAERLPPSDEFAEGGLGGGSGMGGDWKPAIPTAAELLMIKTMQTDLMLETVELGGAVDGKPQPSEADLGATESLGTRQGELRMLTELVVEKAAGRR